MDRSTSIFYLHPSYPSCVKTSIFLLELYPFDTVNVRDIFYIFDAWNIDFGCDIFTSATSLRSSTSFNIFDVRKSAIFNSILLFMQVHWASKWLDFIRHCFNGLFWRCFCEPNCSIMTVIESLTFIFSRHFVCLCCCKNA